MKLAGLVTSCAKKEALGQNYPAFTLVEAMVAISVLEIGTASTIGALIKFNSIARQPECNRCLSAVMNQST
ncbi:MAG: hypothetical protein DMF40_15925 [Verrucomicrobia bacterium]|nr:MAG: hypothetical protein DMF40_15925 [Verrucomicrobiota bacterium]